MYKRNILFKPIEIETSENESISCAICLQNITKAQLDMCTTKCNHRYCTSCLIKNMKYTNECSLCRTTLTSPTQKFAIKYDVSKQIVTEEIEYYKAYIHENINYIINTIEYHSKGKQPITEGIKYTLKKEMMDVFENFGMGVCLNINRTFSDVNVYDTNHNMRPVSPPISPITTPSPTITVDATIETNHDTTTRVILPPI